MFHLMQLEVGNVAGTPVVKFTIDGHSSALGASDIDALISLLSQARANMQPAHPPSPPPAYPLQVDPRWQVEHSPLFDGVVLSLCHVGIGWVAFALPPPSLDLVREALAARPPATLGAVQSAMFN
jgi:hypothetical protein